VPDDWLEEAAACLRNAFRATDPADKQALAERGQRWLMLAAQAEHSIRFTCEALSCRKAASAENPG
jgi:hypothetical protein